MSHRWSGWPGAWCLDCGCEDPYEIALADGDWDVVVADGKEQIVFLKAVEHSPCPEPGSNRHNPYVKV